MKTTLIALLLSLFCSPAFAAIQCDDAPIQQLYLSGGNLYIQLQGTSWHLLAQTQDEDFHKKQSRAMSAQSKGRAVRLTFPNSYADYCVVGKMDVKAKKIKVIK